QIKTVRFEGVVGTEPNVDLNYMFANLTNLTSVDFSNFTQSNPGGSSPQPDTTRNMRGMFYGCTKLEEIKGEEKLTSSRVTDTAQMFYNCKALKAGGFKSSDGTAATKKVNGKDHADFAWINTAKVQTMKEMFYGSGLDYVYMGDNKNDKAVYEMQDMFAGSSVVSVVINNEDFVTRVSPASPSGGSVTSGSVQMQRMFGGCKSLEYIDMSNITIYGRDNWNQLDMMLKDSSGNNATPNLKTVKLKGTKVPNMKRLDGVFDGCKSLETVELGGFVPSDAVTMRNMFRNCTSLKSLDASSFGKLDHIVNMDGFVSGCTSLETLNIDNLDNSRIQPRMNLHHASYTDEGAAAVNADWGRELGIDSCTALKTLSAKNSKVWMVRNSKGSAASGMYWMAENDNAIYYFTNKQMTLAADIGVTVDITTKRDYVDLLTDRHETGDRANGKQEWETNKNMPTESGTHVNKNGEGFLPPGVYTLKADTTLGDEAQPFQDSYYRITGIKSKEPEVTFDKTKFRLIEKGTYGQPHNSIDTKLMDEKGIRELEGWDTGTAEHPLITVTYKDGAKDINGKTHDLVMKITKIKFTGLDKIPENPGRNHDQNIYLDKWGTYSRAIMEYDTGYVALKNYILTEYDRSIVMKSSSGMEIEFTIGVEDALPDTSVLFYLNDLDVMKEQDWTYTEPDDACYDTLDWDDVTYGEGSEGIKLQTGNDLNTLKFANHTGLAIIDGNYIVGTGHDPSTSWS
ncbi:MAG: BspA family leucine-rich repeat surface protein, partial [Mogibacterium sp.]|nr:BspA family leucine-rich repeat surface protein [Mogibacterium sp.]